MQERDYSEIPVSRETETGKFVIVVVLAVTCVLVGGMILDNQRVTLALTCGISFFSFLVVMVMLVQTGQLVSAWHGYQREKTLREENRMRYEVYLREAPAPQIVTEMPQMLPEEPQAILLNTYIPARPPADEAVKVEAYAWVVKLFKEGRPDPERILGKESRSPGQVQAKKPREEVLQYLLSLEMVRGGGKGEMLFFCQDTYNSLRKCQQAIKYGVPYRREHETDQHAR